MDDKILVAIIAASAAILGGVIQKMFDLINNWQKVKEERSKELRNIQKDVYWEFIEAFQKFGNNKSNENFTRFQESINRVLLYGDNNTSKIVNDYFKAIIQEGITKQPLNHKEYQTKVINAMRKHLDMDELESFELILFTPLNKSN
ncbi:MAG: hypothetical protein LUI85_17530 [Bacteroides sp.]|nr:hypothetical protein [Bacteroides sp.]